MSVTTDLTPIDPYNTWSCHYDVHLPPKPPPPKLEDGPIDYAVSIHTDIFEAHAIKPADLSDLKHLLAMLGEGADLALIVYAMQIHQMDRQAAASIQEIQNTGYLREALSARLEQLRETKAGLEKFENMKDGGTTNVFPDDARGSVLRTIDYAVDPKTGTVSTIKGELLGEKKDAHTSGHQISLNDIDAEIKRVEGQAQKLDSDREIKMILFNQTLNRKNQAVSQLTNILKKSHETQSVVINNLR